MSRQSLRCVLPVEVHVVIVPSPLHTGALPAVHEGKQSVEIDDDVLLRSSHDAVGIALLHALVTRSGKNVAMQSACCAV